ncbi:Gfo/Idh/MocA family oxidoreductase [Actinokineospora enzanensis]|uniref:Gfo/Idh/MocA family oxidoreductase n=1 Tax=Actinokineospora enzanensis TaxID=155975 RepID=UPI000373A09A|nr:Gfo/Idh/MocA family oxidoreductase [Actinokineospora enzanensis]
MTAPRVLVCGSGFGRVHLAALADPDFPFTAVGLLARGSARSRTVAARFGVPLYTSLADVPDIDLACVVVGSAPTGGPGARLAMDLLRRGVPVLQEHPLHADELAACLRTARETGTHYRLTSHHVHVAPVRRFIEAVRTLLRHQPPLFLDAITSVQVLYTLLDVLGESLGTLRPWSFAPAPAPAEFPRMRARPPFRSLDGMIAGIPVTLRIQHQLDPARPDNHAHLWHRITLGTEGGTLTLLGSAGPVLWSPRPHLPADSNDVGSFDQLTDAHLDHPTTSLGPPDAPAMSAVLSDLWPAGVRAAIRTMWSNVGTDPMPYGQYHLAVTALAKEISDHLGPVDLINPPDPDVLGADLFLHAAEVSP